MRCSKCDSDNREGRKFCANCGASLTVTCAKCSASNQLGERFCGECGAPLEVAAASATAREALAGRADAARQPIAAYSLPEGERKTITALFADIKGSTELMRELDPEEARAIIDPVLQLMMDAVHRYDGYVAQSTGDGIFAMFGAPVAHEDHPQSALHAALAIQQELHDYRERLKDHAQLRVEARIGVNTGEVVLRTVNTGGHTEYSPVGHVTNLAARMQTIASAGSIVITEECRRLVEGYFSLRALGPTEIKGISEPVNVYEVIGPGPLRGHFELAAQRGLTKFVGRERELADLRRALEFAIDGHGQIVAVVADAGTGKSRLFYEFKATVPPTCKVLEAYSVSHGKASPWLPVLDLLRGYFGIVDKDDAVGRREKVAARVESLDSALCELLPYVFTLLGIQESSDPLAQMDGRAKKERMLEATIRMMLRESVNQPLVIIFQDLHWIDSESQELLNRLVDTIPTARILVLVNYRPEYHHEWNSRTYYTQVRLDPLSRENAAAMLSELVGDEPQMETVKRLIWGKTEGNPFFIEEMVRALFEEQVLVRNGAVNLLRPLASIKVPATLEALMTSRIDRLRPNDKQLLQILAVIGPEFNLPLVRMTAGTEVEQLERSLSDLLNGEFIYRKPAFPDPAFIFKHALTQEVAYKSILIERRKLLHGRVGAAIEALYAGRLDDHLSELAHHFGNSDNIAKAVEYHRKAGEQAYSRGAYTAAITYLSRALELLQRTPPSIARNRQELTLRLSLGANLIAVKSIGAPELAENYLRACELCRDQGHALEILPALFGLCWHYMGKGQVDAARELGSQMVNLAANAENAVAWMWADTAFGPALVWSGEFAAARARLEHGYALYGDQWAGRAITDFGVLCLSYLGLALWPLGFPDQGLGRARDSLELAQRVKHVHSIGHALISVAFAHWLRRDEQQMRVFAEKAIAFAAEHNLSYWLPLGRLLKACAISQSGDHGEAIDKIRHALSAFRTTGSEHLMAMLLGGLVQAYKDAGMIREALASVKEALAVIETCRFYTAELHRLRGELLLMQDPEDSNDAEQSFRTAIHIAKSQDAKSWELRATTGLARLLAKQDRRDEARNMLAEIYNWFTEGFETADLKEARALLDDLILPEGLGGDLL